MFVVKSTAHAKSKASELRARLSEFGIESTHLQSLDLVAAMFGFNNWRDLENGTTKSTPSPFDEESTTEVVGDRRIEHVAVLRNFGVKPTVVEMILDLVRPTGSRVAPDVDRITSQETKDIVVGSRYFVGQGRIQDAVSLLTHTLQHSPRSDRKLVHDELLHLAHFDKAACFNAGSAYLHGDAPGGVDHKKAAELMKRCVSMSSADPKVFAAATCVLGDIAGGNYGGVSDIDAALKLYTEAAIKGRSGAGAFNAARIHEDRGDIDLTIQFCRLGAEVEHVHSMTNLAGMIFDGRASGTGMEMKKLFSKSAQLGDSKAINAMRVIDDLVAHVDNPTPKILRDALGDFQPPWLIDIVPMKTWLKVLTDHGWMLTNVRTKPSGELAPFASAVTTDGSPFGLHISAGMHVSGHKPDKTTDLYRKKYGDADGLIVYNKVMAMATGKNPAITHLCIGRLHKDGVWSDYFLQAGGLEAALRQRLELSKNPFLDPSYKFRNENAVSIAAKIEADTLRKINRL